MLLYYSYDSFHNLNIFTMRPSLLLLLLLLFLLLLLLLLLFFLLLLPLLLLLFLLLPLPLPPSDPVTRATPRYLRHTPSPAPMEK